MNISSKLRSEESGLISIAVTLIIMSILTLMAIGFSNLASREYRQAIDQQLSTQAFYAAESGANLAIENGTANCDGAIYPVGNDNSAAITCVLLNDTPTTLEYSDVGQDSSVIVPITATSRIDKLKISWQAKDGSADFAANCDGQFQDTVGWGGKTPVINAMLIPARDFSGKDNLMQKTQKIFLYPTSSTAGCDGGFGSYTASVGDLQTKGKHVNANCSTSNSPRYCFVEIALPVTGPPSGRLMTGNYADYRLRLKSVYGSSTVSITASNNGNPVNFVGAQREIDSTGRAGDVLRRVKINVPIASQTTIYPEFAVEATDGLCKRMSVGATVTTNPNTGVCAIPTDQTTGTGTSGGSLLGDAGIASTDDPTTGNWTTTGAYYNFRDRLINDSRITAGSLRSCTWDFDDGTVINFPGSAPECDPGYGFRHTFPDVRGLINRTNGSQGCYIYSVRLTNYFYSLPTATDVKRVYIPIGTANDQPNPITGRGICNGNYRNAPNPPINPDTNPANPSPFWTTFPVPPTGP